MTICIHHNDLDGRCAAAIVQKAITGPIAFHETDYKDPAPAEENIRNMDVVIVDFSYKPEVMARIIALAKSVTWIDHHATAKDYPYQYLPGLRNFNEKEKSGCELAWDYYFSQKIPNISPMAVRLIGDYDKWALDLAPSCFQFYEGAKLIPTLNHPDSNKWQLLLDDFGWESIVEDGKIAIQYRDNYCGNLCRSFGYETEIVGHKAYACNQFMFGSGGFGERFKQYPLCLAYIHDGSRFTVSLYSETVDVGQIAKAHGGGGHKGAAGFICEALPFKK